VTDDLSPDLKIGVIRCRPHSDGIQDVDIDVEKRCNNGSASATAQGFSTRGPIPSDPIALEGSSEDRIRVTSAVVK
jgi:hypothetical protein